MNANRIHSSNPLRFLLSFFVWIGLEFLVWNIFSAEKILDRIPEHKKGIEKAIHIICGILALGVSVFLLDDLERLTGYNLLD